MDADARQPGLYEHGDHRSAGNSVTVSGRSPREGDSTSSSRTFTDACSPVHPDAHDGNSTVDGSGITARPRFTPSAAAATTFHRRGGLQFVGGRRRGQRLIAGPRRVEWSHRRPRTTRLRAAPDDSINLGNGSNTICLWRRQVAVRRGLRLRGRRKQLFFVDAPRAMWESPARRREEFVLTHATTAGPRSSPVYDRLPLRLRRVRPLRKDRLARRAGILRAGRRQFEQRADPR